MSLIIGVVMMVCALQATSQLVNALKSEAESQSDSEQQKKLLAAAKLLADATARMVEAAKVINTLGLYRIDGRAGEQGAVLISLKSEAVTVSVCLTVLFP